LKDGGREGIRTPGLLIANARRHNHLAVFTRPLIGKPGKPGYFSPVFLVELDVEKALDEQLFFQALRTERSGHADSISGWPIRRARVQ